MARQRWIGCARVSKTAGDRSRPSPRRLRARIGGFDGLTPNATLRARLVDAVDAVDAAL